MNTSMHTNSKKVLGAVPYAENLLVTSDKRWFAGGSDGLYQIDPDGATPPQKIPVAFDAHSTPSTDNRSFFFGITQHQHFIYATCTPDPQDATSPRYIMLMDMMQSPPSMAAIYSVSNPSFFDGLSTDAAGNLYLTCFGTLFPLRAGKIIKLSMASPTTVASQSDWLAVGGHPNGIKIDGDTLYFSQEAALFVGYAYVKKVRIQADGTPDMPIVIHTAGIGRILDDFELVDGGLVITQAGLIDSFDPTKFHDSPFNQLIHISESGQELHSSPPLSPPSAVRLVPDSTSPSPDLIVTERTGDVIRLRQEWGLKQRH